MTRAARLGLWLLALQPVNVLVELAVAAVVWATGSAPYGLVTNTISDLGAVGCGTVPYPAGPVAVCSPAHAWLNGSCVVGGLALAAGAVLARTALPPGGLRAWAVGLWLVTGASTAASGLVPLDVDLGLHTLVSLPMFLTQPPALLLTALAVRPAHPRLAAWGIGIATVALVCGAAVAFALDALLIGGLLERIASWPTLLWLGLAASLALRAPHLGTRAPLAQTRRRCDPRT